ncbi:mitogen-activated protein kinase 2 [Reticulomyxa filosa]|uniref:Mitogen-activated protein kinase 2 n=1 Tax=Reticulomyxa filosa TaxID=46433 RepID=X6MGL7_RETFI|nr:mitogen-activated protein kinase 2 [Reticulomyxa filosa]|eukprot:ETO13029.1 mitogen-activated protein kinase 2 [Reticulomyxa filosa]
MDFFRSKESGTTEKISEKEKASKTSRKVKNIYTPKPNNEEDDSSDDHECEDEKEVNCILSRNEYFGTDCKKKNPQRGQDISQLQNCCKNTCQFEKLDEAGTATTTSKQKRQKSIRERRKGGGGEWWMRKKEKKKEMTCVKNVNIINSYGVVYEGKALVENGRFGIKVNDKIAIKKVRRVFVTVTDARRLLREIRILRALQDHDCIVRLVDILPPEDPANYMTMLRLTKLVFIFIC